MSHFKDDILIVVPTTDNINVDILEFYLFLFNPFRCHQHGISFSHSMLTTEAYCGVRVPWKFITRWNTIILHLVIRKFKVYSFQLFYSSFDSSWIYGVSTIINIYKDDFTSFDVTKPYSPKNTIVYGYHVMSHKDNYLKIHMTLNRISKGCLMIHDGPGHLSPLLLDVKDLQTVSSKRVQTSAYWTFIRVQLQDLNTNASLSLYITTDHNMRRGLLCTNQYKGSITAISNIWKNTVCMDNIYSPYGYIVLIVETFIFSGPNMVTTLSDSVCQYGGFLVYFNKGTDHYELCHKYTIYTGTNSLTFILVWFSGYSGGNSTAFLSVSDCMPYYPEFSTPLNRPDRPKFPSMIVDTCRIYVCPTLQKITQRHFVLKLDSIGPASITIQRFNTLSTCEPEYAETKLENKSIIRFSTWAFDDWPLSVRSNKSHSIHNVVKKIAIIYLPPVCTPGMTRVQMALFLRKSKCNLFPDGRIRQMPIINIPGLIYPCYLNIYEFTPTGKGPKNYVNFMHKDTGHMNISALINVRYSSCPIECRNYRYSVYVRSKDNETVFQQTAYVGRQLTAGHNHRGYRVPIIQPDQLCIQHMNCVLQLWVNELVDRTKTKIKVLHPNLIFNVKKYDIINNTFVQLCCSAKMILIRLHRCTLIVDVYHILIMFSLWLWVNRLVGDSKGVRNVLYPNLHFNRKRYGMINIICCKCKHVWPQVATLA